MHNEASMKFKVFITILTLSLLSACGATTPSTINASSNGLVVTYHAYGMAPTLSDEAKNMAIRHCSQYYKDAQYIGWELPNPFSTEEHHGFECVERDIDTDKLFYDIEKAMETSAVSMQLDEYLNCIRQSIVSLDDLTSDASTIAFAVADVCSSQHNQYVRQIVSEISYSSNVKGIVKDAFYDSASTKVIPYVLNWRRIVIAGFNQSQVPTESELPNDLYSASVSIGL
jgi:hypothetical protein